ncbi:hypothetical protein Btru_061287 [Bulinus truncatus]|nr:hypothetical protein Btru_061287 [Bulinus truncatus]
MDLIRAIYIYCLLHLVNVIAGNDVILVNQDKDLTQEEDIDTLLENEQFFQSKDGQTKRPRIADKVKTTQKTLPTQTWTDKDNRNSTTVKPEFTKQLSHNCTHSNQGKILASRSSNSSLELQWQRLESAEELEEEADVLGDMDYQYLSVNEESMFHRHKRQALQEISGYGIYSAQLRLVADSGLTVNDTIDGSLNNAIKDSLILQLEKKIPGRHFFVGVKSLRAPNTTIDLDIQISDDRNDVNQRKLLAEALNSIDVDDNFQLGGKTYMVEDVLLGTESGEASSEEYVTCILCPDYQKCDKGMKICQSITGAAIFASGLYPFGVAQADSTMAKNVETTTQRVKISDGISWDQEEVTNVWISPNGFLSLGSEFSSYSPARLPAGDKKLLAVYWSDIDLSSGDAGDVYYQLYTKYGNFNKKVFSQSNADVIKHAGVTSYDATTVLIVTWHNVAPSPLKFSQSERATFQCAVISDGSTTYAVYYYGNAAMRFEPRRRRPVVVGWGSTTIDSWRTDYYNFDQITGNTGEIGKWFFKIGEKENVRMKCINWYHENKKYYNTIRFWDSLLPQCPCNEFFAWSSGMWFAYSENNIRCYQSFNSAIFYGRTCCYATLLNSTLMWTPSAFGRTFGTFENRIPLAGSLQRHSPFYGRDYGSYWYHDGNWFSWKTTDHSNLHQVNDLDPKQWCCYQSNMCHLYYDVRPASTCVGSSVVFGFGFGDPQITTLDKKLYVFNGLGEYRLMEIIGQDPENSSMAVNFQLQGRTCRFGESINATVWCALALQTTNKIKVTIEISKSGNSMIIYANGQDYSLRFRENENFTAVDIDVYLRREKDSLKISTIDGAVSKDSSLFEHYLGQTISDPTFLPVFTDEVAYSFKIQAESFCNGTTNLACINDYLASGNSSIALLSQELYEVFQNQANLTGNKAPVISGRQAFNITVNTTLNILLNCSDPDGGDLYVYFISQPKDGFNYTFDNITGSLNISFTPLGVTNETFEIIVYDSEGLSSGVYKANLTVCSGCSNNGHCDFSELQRIHSPYYFVAECLCRLGYYGDNCEIVGGCSVGSCPMSKNCDDLPPSVISVTGISFQCRDCPAGYALVHNQTKCEDVNECEIAPNPCPANSNCSNTIGSYECVCGNGYRMVDNFCKDIDECAEYQHDCEQICINEPSTFHCDCYPGYKRRGLIYQECMLLKIKLIVNNITVYYCIYVYQQQQKNKYFQLQVE